MSEAHITDTEPPLEQPKDTSRQLAVMASAAMDFCSRFGVEPIPNAELKVAFNTDYLPRSPICIYTGREGLNGIGIHSWPIVDQN